MDRARAVRPGFALTEGNAAAVAEICRRLEGLPLAIELAAARIRLLDPAALLGRLAASLDALGTGARDLPARQQTLRATVEWSMGLLTDAERSLLETAAVFADGWTGPAAAQVSGLDEDRALELTEALARHSLIYLDSTALGPRLRMLETVREFVAEHLAARPDATEVGRRHAGYYRALAEQADRPLRGAGRGECLERLQAEAGNLAAAVRWYLAHDTGPLPPCSGSCGRSGSCGTTCARAGPGSRNCCPPQAPSTAQARAELIWTAAVLAVEVVDDPGALAASRRLGPLPAGIEARFYARHPSWPRRGVRRSPAITTVPCARRRPSWNSSRPRRAVLHRACRHRRHPGGARPLRRCPGPPARGGRTGRPVGQHLADPVTGAAGHVAILRGRGARALLEEALDLSVAARSTASSCPAFGYARLAFAEDDPERAARLEGAAEGLRRRRLRALAASAQGRPSWQPKPARRWARTGSIRRSPPAPHSPSGRR